MVKSKFVNGPCCTLYTCGGTISAKLIKAETCWEHSLPVRVVSVLNVGSIKQKSELGADSGKGVWPVRHRAAVAAALPECKPAAAGSAGMQAGMQAGLEVV